MINDTTRQELRHFLTQEGYGNMRQMEEHPNETNTPETSHKGLGIIILHGEMDIFIGNKEQQGQTKKYKEGDKVIIPPNTWYNFNTSDLSCQYLIGQKIRHNAQDPEGKEMQQSIYAYMQTHHLCVLSSVRVNHKPQSAIMEYILREDLSLIVATRKDFRKYNDLMSRPHVSLVIGGEDERTVQYEGKVNEIDFDDLTAEEKQHSAKHLHANYFYGLTEEITYLLVTPHWVRLTDVGKQPWVKQEIYYLDSFCPEDFCGEEDVYWDEQEN